jgi:tetratricopeptide (TPR) repeat protein
MNNEINNSRLSQLFTMLAMHGNDPFIHYAIAMEYSKEQNHVEACNWLQKTLAIDPQYLAAYYHLAQAYIYQEQTDTALLVLEKGILLAKERKDQKSLAELQNSKMNLELED